MKKVVVIGGVAAGLKSAAKVRREDPEAQITVFEKGSLISYGACGMPYYVGGLVADVNEFMKTPAGAMRNPGFFKNVKDIDVRIRTLVTAIDRAAKTVTVKNLETNEETAVPYDKLVIATGASPVRPPLPGIELGGIHQFWHPDDAVAVRSGIDAGRIKSAVVIGAGLVGMEMAEAFKTRGVDVTVIEMQERVFPAFLDVEIAGSVAKYATENGIKLLLGEKVERFNGEGTVREVVTDKRVIPADIVVLSIGVRPNTELAKAAGLAIGPTGAIAVNEYMETSDPDIYAGGDCVENTNIISGKKVFAPMGSTANKHGRVIGENIGGNRVKFRGVLNTVAVKVLNLHVGKTGLTEREAKELGYQYVTAMVAGPDKPHYMPGSKPVTIKLIVEADSRKLLGAQAFGEGEVVKRIDVMAAALTMGMTIDDLFDMDLAYAPPYSSPIDNVAVAANAIMNKLEGKLKGISSLTAKEKMDEGKAIFLDVRSPEEFNQIRLANCRGVKNIPLGQLRTRLSEIGKDDEVIAFCKISLRGYEAACILEGAGFENVKVMEGGIVSWPYACEK
ncbi:FAD-dependent oxidoreductase [Sporomusa malonica]|uniref:NADPH-dependent 2,4-dienoyl-CoA reductase, sulfur reductase n=1 Tax=Sporomusa malonica TaxID=112901 RepID=A0A1W2EU46_9FIRM|nr:FAD-dependent oxidoreductase [Sporomusa malonica]SMD13240.1 NADPH-dependent 2,4-dienoyl-CoA reductase, sulfur reductase [Sporomusa malonica]